MSRHTPEEKERWKIAADKEDVPFNEFMRLAANARADKVLDPARGLIGGLVGTVFGAAIRELGNGQEKVCICGHDVRQHASPPAAVAGSCGVVTCSCTKFREQGRKSIKGG